MPLLSEEHGKLLAGLARDSIRHFALHGKLLSVELAGRDRILTEKKATFVTLKKEGKLRGCIGELEARQALIRSVVENAQRAAFHDPRFDAVTLEELESLDLSISVLSQPESIRFQSEEALLRQIRPGEDGLILKEGSRCGTFLPSVWEDLPTAELFLRHLKQKAGLSPDYWSDRIEIWRYRAEVFQE